MVFCSEKAIFSINLSKFLTNSSKLRLFVRNWPDFADSEGRNRCQIFFEAQPTQKLFKNKKLRPQNPNYVFQTPEFKSCLEHFEHFQTRPNYQGTFPVLKVEKPEKVVWEKRKSFSALFLETLLKKKFLSPHVGGGFEFPKIAQKQHSLRDRSDLLDVHIQFLIRCF